MQRLPPCLGVRSTASGDEFLITDMKNMRNDITIRRNTSVLTSLALMAAALVLTSGCKKEAPPAPPPPTVQVAEITLTNVPMATEFIKQLDSPQNVEVRARVEAFVDKMLFTE